MNMYTDIILDYYRHPRNYGKIEDAQIKARDSNPLCGDTIEIHILTEPEGQANNLTGRMSAASASIGKEIISDIKFSGKGCAISQAAASILTDMIKGKSLEQAAKLDKDDILESLGIEISAVRLKCALLSLKVLKTGILDYLGKHEFDIMHE